MAHGGGNASCRAILGRRGEGRVLVGTYGRCGCSSGVPVAERSLVVGSNISAVVGVGLAMMTIAVGDELEGVGFGFGDNVGGDTAGFVVFSGSFDHSKGRSGWG